MVEYLLEQADRMRRSPLGFFVRNWHMTILFLLAIVLGGAYSLMSMPLESAPEVKIPIATVTTVYPGASPADIEKLVTDELERKIQNIDNVVEVTSESREGVSAIVVEFDASADLETSMRDLRDEVDNAKGELPSDAEDPVVNQIRIDDTPIVTFTMAGTAPIVEFERYAEDIEDILEDIKGVNRVEISGLPQREMQVIVDIRALEGKELSVADIARTISSHHTDLPIGTIRTNELYYQVSLKGQFKTAKDLEDLAIASREGKSILLRDIAEIRETFGEPTSASMLYTAESGTHEESITIQLFKNVGEDLVQIVGEAKDLVEEFNKTLPEDLRIDVTDDESVRINRDIANLLSSAWQTVTIIAITLLLALGRKEAFAAALTVPILYLISFCVLAYIGSTFNFLTFFALILSLGIVVDTSVVIIEGIYENMNDHDMESEDAALASLATYQAPLTSGTLTTIAAFVPLALMTGIMGEYVKHIPITVNITLLSSLFAALMILPAMAVKILKKPKSGAVKKQPFLAPYFAKLGDWYGNFIDNLFAHKARQRGWIASMILLFFLSIGLSAAGIIKFQLFSSPDVDIFMVNVSMPEGTTLDVTRQATKKVEEYIEELPELVRYVSVYNAGSTSIRVTLTDPKERSISSIEIAQMLRQKVRNITEAEVLVSELESGPGTGADIEARVLGDDMKSVQEFAAVVERELEAVKGTEDVTNDLEISPGEFHIRAKRDRLAYFGIDAATLASMLRTSVYGDDRTKIKESGEETPIVITLDYRTVTCTEDPLTQLKEAKDEITICRNDPQSIADIENLLIPTQRGQVPVSELVDVSLEPAVTTIRHFNTDRVVRVSGNVQEGVTPAEGLSALLARLENIETPEGIRIEFGGENEDTAESMASLGRASILAVIIIFAILTYQFASFKQVFIVLFTMPLAVMGVLYALALLRVPMSFPGMIGLVALLGIVVNDAIVLIDRINTNRLHTENLIEAVKNGCKQRMQPVLITTLTTALGVLPLVYNGDVFRDLAIVVAAGITVATVFTLVMVPIFYVAFERKREGPGFITRILYLVRIKKKPAAVEHR